MKKDELLREVAERTGQSLVATRAVVDAVCEVAHECVGRGEEFFALGLGKLVTKRRKRKAARNIWTGEKVMVPSRTVVLFKPSDSLVRAAN
jgi:DNA-binding protein HU-beta